VLSRSVTSKVGTERLSYTATISQLLIGNRWLRRIQWWNAERETGEKCSTQLRAIR